MEAAESGADYVGVGAFFPTATKEARFQADIALVQWWSELMTVPLVAIGGITVDNCRPLIDAGADFLAVSAGVWAHAEGPAPPSVPSTACSPAEPAARRPRGVAGRRPSC